MRVWTCTRTTSHSARLRGADPGPQLDITSPLCFRESLPARQQVAEENSNAAMATLEEGLETFPASANLHVAMGSICREDGDSDLARELCTTAPELDPRNEAAADLLRYLEKDWGA